jgi:hypothetical protein
MATKLSKPVKRELNRVRATKNGRIEVPDKTGFITAEARPVVASLQPADIIEFRVKGTRRSYSAPLATVMMFAQAMTFYDEYNEAKRVYELHKSAGYKRKRKPRKPSHPHISAMLRRLHGAVSGG